VLRTPRIEFKHSFEKCAFVSLCYINADNISYILALFCNI